MKIAIIGAGAMGGLFAARLAGSGQNVSLVETSPTQIAAIRSGGLSLSSDFGEENFRLPVGPATDYSGSFDLIIVFTKGMHTEAAMVAAKHLVGPHTWVMTVQNGIGNVEAIEAFTPRDRIVMGMTNWPSTLVSPGHIRVSGDGEVRLWNSSGTSSHGLEEIGQLLRSAGLNCVLDPSVEIAIWEKLAFNSAMNSLAATADVTVGQMADSTQAREIVSALLSEALAVALARGVKVAGCNPRSNTSPSTARSA